eukprot:jgi/Mesen1/1347/ME000013S00837
MSNKAFCCVPLGIILLVVAMLSNRIQVDEEAASVPSSWRLWRGSTGGRLSEADFSSPEPPKGWRPANDDDAGGGDSRKFLAARMENNRKMAAGHLKAAALKVKEAKALEKDLQNRKRRQEAEIERRRKVRLKAEAEEKEKRGGREEGQAQGPKLSATQKPTILFGGTIEGGGEDDPSDSRALGKGEGEVGEESEEAGGEGGGGERRSGKKVGGASAEGGEEGVLPGGTLLQRHKGPAKVQVSEHVLSRLRAVVEAQKQKTQPRP